MLRQILELLEARGIWTVEDLARELHTTPQLIVAAMEDLARRGRLREVHPAACGTSCAACPAAAAGSAKTACPAAPGGCVTGTADRIWTASQ